MKNNQIEQPKLASFLSSLVIISFLGTQLYTAKHLRDWWPKFRRLQTAYKLLKPPKKPALWPFIDYPMYSYAKNEGSGIKQYSAFGILPDSTEVPIIAEDLGLDYWVFNYGFIASLRQKNYQDIKKFAQLYQKINKQELISIRLENKPLILSIDSIEPGEKEIVVDIKREVWEEK